VKGSKSLLFLKKKKQKNFAYCGLWLRRCLRPQEQKFFASFFQKRSAYSFDLRDFAIRLIALFPGAPRHLSVNAATVAQLLDELDRQWPGMRDRLRDSTPAIRRHIKIIVGQTPAALETALASGDQVYILTAISGG
jgi:molybdopterin converting factor small subunit